MSSLISNVGNILSSPFHIPDSPVPNKEDMFCRNAPKLKDVPLCLFLKKMDEQRRRFKIESVTLSKKMNSRSAWKW